MGVVTVGALEEDALVVNEDAGIANLNLAEAVLLCGGLKHLALGVEQLEIDGIEVGRFGTP